MQLPIGKNGISGSAEEATVTLQELIPAWRKWGKSMGDMVRIRKSVLTNVNMPEETMLFLNKVGLAEAIYYGTLTPTLPRLTELVSETGSLPTSFARYRVLGEVGYRMFQCLDEEESGQVVVVIANPDYEKIVLFANSSIQHYAECCIVAEEIWHERARDHVYFPSPEWDKFIAKYEQAIRAIDPLALADESTWHAREMRNLKAGIW
jgi:hypothetical protein